MFLLNLVSELKFLNVFMGQEGPKEFNIWLYLCFLFVFVSMLECFVGVMGGIFLTPLLFIISIYICFDPFILIVGLNYLQDNSVISLESSY
jgi:uncharacterized membrane protein YfcA